MKTALDQFVGITAGYAYSIATLLETMPTLKLACWNWIMTGRM